MDTRIHRALVAGEDVRSRGAVGFTPVRQFFAQFPSFLTRN